MTIPKNMWQSGVMSAIVCAALSSASLHAAEPAVSEVNGKVSMQGGDVMGSGASTLDAVLALPLGHSFGLQLDGSSGSLLNQSYSGVGGHVFWRDPSVGLLGLTGTNQKIGNTLFIRNGVEGEAYLNQFSIGVRGGYQGGDMLKGDYFGIGGRWYINDNLVVNLGYDHAPGDTTTNGVGIEWQPTSWGTRQLALFARATETVDSGHAGAVGIRYYFGGEKSLIQRHRTSDPESLVMPMGDVIPTPSIQVNTPAPVHVRFVNPA